MLRLQYKLLNRDNVLNSAILREVECPLDELHVRKLVDATLFSGKVYEHTSNAWENGEVVYLEAGNGVQLPKHPMKVYGYTIEYHENVQGNLRLIQSQSHENFSSIVTRLLDHYTVVAGKDYELKYSILDEDRGVVMIYVVPEA
ncbi:hypothetical protein [Brevibacillus sp. SYSU BS000544]|uniref:hypothetical protein n=1 Tax=Brevibacillus sp. SYSU BS000544 TaxID=3416443 RepID=UPI003CE4CF8F